MVVLLLGLFSGVKRKVKQSAQVGKTIATVGARTAVAGTTAAVGTAARVGSAVAETGIKTVSTAVDLGSDAVITGISMTPVPELADLGLTQSGKVGMELGMAALAGYDAVANTTDAALVMEGLPPMPRVHSTPLLRSMHKWMEEKSEYADRRSEKIYAETFADGWKEAVLDEDALLRFKRSTEDNLKDYKNFVDKNGSYVNHVARNYRLFELNLKSGMDVMEAAEMYAAGLERAPDRPHINAWDLINVASLATAGGSQITKNKKDDVVAGLMLILAPKLKKLKSMRTASETELQEGLTSRQTIENMSDDLVSSESQPASSESQSALSSRDGQGAVKSMLPDLPMAEAVAAAGLMAGAAALDKASELDPLKQPRNVAAGAQTPIGDTATSMSDGDILILPNISEKKRWVYQYPQ